MTYYDNKIKKNQIFIRHKIKNQMSFETKFLFLFLEFKTLKKNKKKRPHGE